MLRRGLSEDLEKEPDSCDEKGEECDSSINKDDFEEFTCIDSEEENEIWYNTGFQDRLLDPIHCNVTKVNFKKQLRLMGDCGPPYSRIQQLLYLVRLNSLTCVHCTSDIVLATARSLLSDGILGISMSV